MASKFLFIAALVLYSLMAAIASDSDEADFTFPPTPICDAENHEKLEGCGEKPCNSQTCARPELTYFCTKDCYQPGSCVCERGYYRDECTRKCVKSLDECSPAARISPFNVNNCA